MKHPSPTPTDDLLRRAFAAYFRSGGDLQHLRGKVVTHNELTYVVLHNGGVLAVYRVRTYDGALRRMKRWPSEIEES